ncbi:hypothetical protein HYN59_14405 [Flavobacterium album]|uniref:Uncharacterized protein n=1 Tax=Flavobacterium album TaxID=2175091 RepID=A0A2S1R0M4_9FLAO|nr:hypothetical protein [Flavobacterium album]AWH86227.1 hypothetical protein HYN59_14405 [Flavobacterium album]
MRLFFRIFVLVLMAETFLGLLSLLLETKSADYAFLNEIGSVIMFFLSLPFNLVAPGYPYYTPESESGLIVALLVALTLIIHTSVIYLLYKAVTRPEFK